MRSALAMFSILAGCATVEPPPPTNDVRSAPFPPDPAHMHPSLPPGYLDPIPTPDPQTCAGCSYHPVLVGSDRVLLCSHEPSTPIKPLDRFGTLRRESMSACEYLCCPRP